MLALYQAHLAYCKYVRLTALDHRILISWNSNLYISPQLHLAQELGYMKQALIHLGVRN